MNNKQFPLLTQKELSTLHDSLHYMKIAELKKACLFLGITEKGKKTSLIERILNFIKTGSIIDIPKIPARSLARNHPIQPLAPSSLILYGEYKNDLKTRMFLKKLIGQHFHFTVFGIDWINEHWQKGDPPTYQKFATFWTKEFERRKQEKSQPKDEWMFIRFVQKIKKEKPLASQKDIVHMWKIIHTKKQKKHCTCLIKQKYMFLILQSYKSNIAKPLKVLI